MYRFLIFTFILTYSSICFGSEQNMVQTYNVNAIDFATTSNPASLNIVYPSFNGYENPVGENHCIVDLSYTRDLQTDLDLTYPFKVTVTYQFSGSNYTLSIEYDPTTSDVNHIFTDYEVHSMSTSLSANIEVTDVTYSYKDNGTWYNIPASMSDLYIPEDIRLMLKWKSDRLYEMDDDRYLRLYTEHHPGENNIELNFQYAIALPGGVTDYRNWNGAEEYEIEYVFIDKESKAFNQINYNNPENQFELKEPVRITTRHNHFFIDDEFREGIVFFRVRGVGRYLPNYTEVRKYGPWAYHHTVPAEGEPSGENYLAHVDITAQNAFSPDKNWQYTASFSDYGVMSKSVSYFDGTLRSRQTAAYNEVDDVTLVGEQKYDYEGRASISIIPGMVDGKSLEHHSKFNGTYNGSSLDEFLAADFDKDNPDPIVPAPGATNNGASKYYSEENNFTDDPFRDRIDNAGGMVYNQTRFKKDGTGRVTEVRGVGDVLSEEEREQRFYYGVPTQRELKELMGDDIGDAKYYKENVSRDPNGQHKFSIVDNLGNTVISGLVGTPPGNLKNLVPPGGTNYKVSPIVTDNVVDNNFEKTSQHVEVVLGASSSNPLNYYFEYDMTPVIYGVNDPASATPICASCVYTLEFKIYAPDMTIVDIPNDADYAGPSVDVQTYTFSGSGVSCGSGDLTQLISAGNATGGLDKIILGTYQFEQEGEFRIVKKLTVDYQGMIDNVDPASYFDFNTYLDEAMQNVDYSGCFSDCEEYTVALAEYEYMLNKAPQDPDWDALTTTEQDIIIEPYFEEYCEIDFEDIYQDGEENDLSNDPNNSSYSNPVDKCSGMLMGMEQQVRPGGYEFEDADFQDMIDGLILAEDLSLFDANGDDIYVDLNSGWQPGDAANYIFNNPSNFREEWVDDLVQYHREYCHYEVCVELQSPLIGGLNSDEFDLMVMSQHDWDTQSMKSYYWNSSNNPFITSSVNTNSNISSPLEDILIDVEGSSYDLEEYTKDQVFGSSTYTVSSQSDKDLAWAAFVGRYQYEKNLIIDEYKQFLDDDDVYEQGCLYYDDDYAIYPANELDEDGDGTLDATEISNISSQVLTAINPDCPNVCWDNVDYWMTFVPNSCVQELQDPGSSSSNICNGACGTLYEEVRWRLYNYCVDICNPGNPGWLYDNGDPEYDDIIELLSCNFVIPTPNPLNPNPLAGSTVTAPNSGNTVTITNGCEQLFIDFFNDEMLACLNTNSSNVSNCITQIPSSHAFYNCVFPGLGGNKFVEPISYDINFNVLKLEINSNISSDVYIIDLSFNGLFLGSGPLTEIQMTSLDKTNCRLNFNQIINPAANNSLMAVSFTGELDCFFNSGLEIDIWEEPGSAADDSQDCIDAINAEIEQIAYNEMLEDILALQNKFLDIPCMDIEERLTMSYPDFGEYYTLYYYDHTNNLVATVPPKGVHKLDGSAFDGNGVWDGTNPQHILFTTYEYNGLNQMISKTTPDAGKTDYYYDDNKRLRFSQTEQQVADDKLSYTKYDEVSRVVESGETVLCENSGTTIPAEIAANMNDMAWPDDNFTQYTQVYYDDPFVPSSSTIEQGIQNSFIDQKQNHLRNRVATTVSFVSDIEKDLHCPIPNEIGDGFEYTTITSFSYDAHGNVDELVQTLGLFGDYAHQHISYDYDLVSGNTNEVIYQEGEEDEYRHHYDYDLNERLVRVFTSNDGFFWEQDAKYFYGLDGSMMRMELGHDKVQGIDYAMNMQGWLKGVNSTTLKAYRDLGSDAETDDLNQWIGTDVYGYNLGYHEGDYNPVGASAADAFANTGALIAQNTDVNGNYGNLYNGNISHMVTAMMNNNEEVLDIFGNNYTYDQLQRIKTMDVFVQDDIRSTNSFDGMSAFNTDAFITRYSYDLNGNFESLFRNGSGDNLFANNDTEMDDLEYFYYKSDGSVVGANNVTHDGLNSMTNKLAYVYDHVSDGTVLNYNGEYLGAENPVSTSTYYQYDKDGRLIADPLEGIEEIKWTADNKVKYIDYVEGGAIRFIYDGNGNRVLKRVYNPGPTNFSTTYYVRDAQGNVLTTYKVDAGYYAAKSTSNASYKLYLNEHHLYGSKRLGLKQYDELLAENHIQLDDGNMENGAISNSFVDYYDDVVHDEQRIINQKKYELTNHLGNVLNVVTDLKLHADNEQLIYDNEFDQTTDLDDWTFIDPEQDGGAAFNPALDDEVILNNAILTMNYPTIDGHEYRIEYGFEALDNIDNVLIELDNGGFYTWTWLSPNGYQVGNKNITSDGNDIFISFKANGDFILDFVKIYDKTANTYVANVVSYSDYYPFGMQMPGRKGQTPSYRYGFQSQEKDDEVKGEGNSYTTTYRFYDSRLGRWLSQDPVTHHEFSPYSAYDNNPVYYKDPNGANSEGGPCEKCEEAKGGLVHESRVDGDRGMTSLPSGASAFWKQQHVSKTYYNSYSGKVTIERFTYTHYDVYNGGEKYSYTTVDEEVETKNVNPYELNYESYLSSDQYKSDDEITKFFTELDFKGDIEYFNKYGHIRESDTYRSRKIKEGWRSAALFLNPTTPWAMTALSFKEGNYKSGFFNLGLSILPIFKPIQIVRGGIRIGLQYGGYGFQLGLNLPNIAYKGRVLLKGSTFGTGFNVFGRNFEYGLHWHTLPHYGRTFLGVNYPVLHHHLGVKGVVNIRHHFTFNSIFRTSRTNWIKIQRR